jgi:hypothetical protein
MKKECCYKCILIFLECSSLIQVQGVSGLKEIVPLARYQIKSEFPTTIFIIF